ASAIIPTAEPQVPATTLTAAPARVAAAPSRRRKGVVDTPLFEGMLVEQEVDEEGDVDEHVEEVTAGDDAHGDDSAAHGEVHTRVDTFDDTVMDDESNQGRMSAKIDKDDAVVLMDDKEEDKKVEEAKVDGSAQVQGRQAESQDKIYKIDMDNANKVLSMQEDENETAKVQEVVDVVTTEKLITEVVTAAGETVTAASAIIPTAEPQVPATTLTAAPARVAAAPSRRRKGVKNQRTVHGQAKVKSWKILESCGVQIITFTTTQLILLVERSYPLSRFTLDQMLNVVRLQVEEESEMSLELLRFTRQQHQEDQLE
nr:hypothetical protein [Tanacetum cinerariifolium]